MWNIGSESVKMFTRRHYVRIANILADNNADDNLITEFALMFSNDNERFDIHKFYMYIQERRMAKL